MAGFGIAEEGFNIKGLDVILAESLSRAKDMFGANVDLTATSPLLKILQVTAAEDAELWKRMEDLYYSNFISTACGDNLDLLGEDVGLPRQQLFSEGAVTFTVNKPTPGRKYELLEGTVVVTATAVAFYTVAPLSLSAGTPEGSVTVRAFQRGKEGDIVANTIVGIDPAYQQIYLNNLGAASVSAKNVRPFSGGTTAESDEVYRARLLGLPRNIWTLESVRRAVLDVPGVIDVLISDPLGGVDVSQSYFGLFDFDQRLFSAERRIGEPYFFDIVVAHEFVWPWHTRGLVRGIFEQVSTAVDRVRPIGIHPSIIEANHIEVGVQAKVIVQPGYDNEALLHAIKQRIAVDIGALKLGGDVLYSQVIRAFVEQSGIVDVQNMHLRRCPAAFGRITFGAVPFQTEVIEAAIGENLIMGPTEIAIFQLDSDLIDLEVASQQ